MTDWLPKAIEEARKLFPDFVLWARENVLDYITTRTDKKFGTRRDVLALNKWRWSSRYPSDVETYVHSLVLSQGDGN